MKFIIALLLGIVKVNAIKFIDQGASNQELAKDIRMFAHQETTPDRNLAQTHSIKGLVNSEFGTIAEDQSGK